MFKYGYKITRCPLKSYTFVRYPNSKKSELYFETTNGFGFFFPVLADPELVSGSTQQTQYTIYIHFEYELHAFI